MGSCTFTKQSETCKSWKQKFFTDCFQSYFFFTVLKVELISYSVMVCQPQRFYKMCLSRISRLYYHFQPSSPAHMHHQCLLLMTFQKLFQVYLLVPCAAPTMFNSFLIHLIFRSQYWIWNFHENRTSRLILNSHYIEHRN